MNDNGHTRLEMLRRGKSVTGMWSVTAAWVPGDEYERYFSSKTDAVYAAAEVRKQPWNRNANSPLIGGPDGEGWRL